jgi:hypothetical protein
LFGLLQVKHMLADFFFQTPFMLSGRGEYLHPGRALHAGVHLVGSVIAFLIVGAPLAVIAIIVVLEWVAHFHIDWAKARYSEAHALAPNQAVYWRAMGLDQGLHQLTYIAMVWAWVEMVQ